MEKNQYEISYLPNKFDVIWEKTKEMFNKEIKTLTDLNLTFFKGESDFLKEIEKSYPEDGEEFLKVYKHISSLILELDKVFEKNEIDILKSNTTDEITLTRKQAAVIFILGFFNIFYSNKEKMQVNRFFDFDVIISSNKEPEVTKGRSFLNYMKTIGKWLEEKNEILDEKVTYIREKKYFDIKNYGEKKKLCDVEICESGSLFDSEASFFVDFANEYIGGGVLSGGCVQEEILFTVEPEAVVSIFFMEKMDDNDAIRIDNLIKYSDYSGYGFSFKYEKSAINDEKIIRHNIIAIDALCDFSGGVDKTSVRRDFIKAYVGFNLINYQNEGLQNLKKTIATGNWGCGAFGGDFELKFIQQLLAATYAGVDKLYYYTFQREEMKNILINIEKIKSLDANDLYHRTLDSKLSKGKVLEIILNSNKEHLNKKNKNIKKNKMNKACYIY